MRPLRITLGLSALTTLVLLSACGRANREVEGIWHFYASTASTTSCTSTTTHNFADVWENETTDTGESPWTEEQTYEESPAEFFGSLAMSGDQYVLLIGGDIYEGEESDGRWTLVLDQSERSSAETSHESGYARSATVDQKAEYRFAGQIDKGSWTGVWTSSSETTSKWTESDTWSLELANEIGSTGQIPSYSYLYAENDFGLVEPLYNEYDEAECNADPCTLTVVSVCQSSFDFVADRTDLTLADWEAVAGSSQDYGI